MSNAFSNANITPKNEVRILEEIQRVFDDQIVDLSEQRELYKLAEMLGCSRAFVTLELERERDRRKLPFSAVIRPTFLQDRAGETSEERINDLVILAEHDPAIVIADISRGLIRHSIAAWEKSIDLETHPAGAIIRDAKQQLEKDCGIECEEEFSRIAHVTAWQILWAAGLSWISLTTSQFSDFIRPSNITFFVDALNKHGVSLLSGPTLEGFLHPWLETKSAPEKMIQAAKNAEKIAQSVGLHDEKWRFAAHQIAWEMGANVLDLGRPWEPKRDIEAFTRAVSPPSSKAKEKALLASEWMKKVWKEDRIALRLLSYEKECSPQDYVNRFRALQGRTASLFVNEREELTSINIEPLELKNPSFVKRKSTSFDAVSGSFEILSGSFEAVSSTFDAISGPVKDASGVFAIDDIDESLMMDKTETLTEQVELLHEKLFENPRLAKIYHELFACYLELEEIDRAWCMASALVIVGEADKEEEAFFQKHYITPHKHPQRALKLSQLRKLNHPDLDLEVSSLYGLIASTLIKDVSVEPDDWGLRKRKDRLSLDHSFSKMVSFGSDILAAPEIVVYRKRKKLGLRNANMHPIALVAGNDMFSGKSKQELEFKIARAISLLRPDFYLASAFPLVEVLKSFFYAAVFVTTGQMTDEVPAKTLHKFAQMMQENQNLSYIQRRIHRILERSENVSIVDWLIAADHTANRIGLLFCGDLHAAVRMIDEEELRIGNSTRGDKLRELVKFATSRLYFNLREYLYKEKEASEEKEEEKEES